MPDLFLNLKKEALLGAFGPILGDLLSYTLDKIAFCAFFAIIITQQLVYGIKNFILAFMNIFFFNKQSKIKQRSLVI